MKLLVVLSLGILVAAPAWGQKAPDLRLVYTSGVAGEIEPCG